MKELNKNDFERDLQLPALLTPNSKIFTLTRTLKPLIYQQLRVDKVQPSNQTHKYIILKPNTTLAQLQPLLQDLLQPLPNLTTCKVHLTHQNYTTSELFNHYHPDIPSPNSFESIGHIAHYNLTKEQRPHGKLIGDILVLQNPLIKTVVNKTDKLHNVYRTPELELLAGEKDYEVEVREQGTRLRLDFQRVYWCSRLQPERDRLLDMLKKHETLMDLFCGVGPLAVRAARKGLHVIANDLNPDCYKYLVQNSKINKVQHRMLCFNSCARQVLKKWYDPTFTSLLQQPFRKFHHVYMNLPVDAIEFLDVFRGFLVKSKWSEQELPMIHVNGFVVAADDQEGKTKMAERIAKVLPNFTKEQIVHFEHIKNVTVIMRMYCVSFRLGREDAMVEDLGEFQPEKKKVKTQ